MRIILGMAFAALLLVAVLQVYIRTAPVVVADWHVDLPADGVADCVVHAGVADARLACLLAQSPEQALAALDGVAMATPRTTRLAGGLAEGRLTWVTRSALWGFPDYTTAVVRPDGAGGARLDIWARSRFGRGDMGVNAARLAEWQARLAKAPP